MAVVVRRVLSERSEIRGKGSRLPSQIENGIPCQRIRAAVTWAVVELNRGYLAAGGGDHAADLCLEGSDVAGGCVLHGGRPGSHILDQPDRGAVSVYAQGGDYHDLVKKRLKALARWMVEACGAEVKVFVDTAPVMEKHLAQRAGLGWQGKHTNLVSRDWGSWLFLGEIYCDLTLEPDRAGADYCGSCRRCLDACPTDAFPAPYRLDARRCISYLTIEHKGHIPLEFRPAMGNRIYGCDDCLAVCPWNKFARATEEPALLARAELTARRLADLAQLDDRAFRQVFAGSPVKRTGRDRFVRNVLIALGNCGQPDAASAVRPLLDDASPLVRAMAVWALSRLLSASEFAALREARLPREADREVGREWLRD